MNYVFFDIECANCLHGEGKICSFGYVKTDEAFNVIKKKDILINPDAPFLLGNAKTGNGIKLAYPLFRFRWSHLFPSYYDEIKNLLTDPNTLSFGFAVNQDVSYISYSCRRYNLPYIEFSFFDIQKLDKEIFKRDNPMGLDSLVEKYHAKTFTYHRSDDDALMTMEVFRGLLNENHLKVQEAINYHPNALRNTDSLLSQIEEKRKNTAKKEALRKKLNEFYVSLEDLHADVSYFDSFFWKKSFYLDMKIMTLNLDYLNSEKDLLYKKGAKLIRNPNAADVIVIFDSKSPRPHLIENHKVTPMIVFSDFKSKLERKTK
ncbi:MAG: 3'-5' exonuclease [Bacilli bacterium]|jgi:DNA polymerase III alpha subunit (gram-positive type)